MKIKGNRFKNKLEDIIVLSLRVLGYLEDDGQWAAHCLETDLVGYGKTFEDALKDLNELTDMQISFAISRKQPALLDHSAPAWVYEIYNKLSRTYLQRFTEDNKLMDNRHKVASIPLPNAPRSSGISFVQA